jgi:hypothetical protein
MTPGEERAYLAGWRAGVEMTVQAHDPLVLILAGLYAPPPPGTDDGRPEDVRAKDAYCKAALSAVAALRFEQGETAAQTALTLYRMGGHA